MAGATATLAIALPGLCCTRALNVQPQLCSSGRSSIRYETRKYRRQVANPRLLPHCPAVSDALSPLALPQAATHAHEKSHAASHEHEHAHGHDHDAHGSHSAHGMQHSTAAGHGHAHEEGGLPEGLAGLVLVCGFLAMMLLDHLQHAAGGSCGHPGHSHAHGHAHSHGGHAHSHSHGGDEGSDKSKDKARGGSKGAGDGAAADAAAAGGGGKPGQEGSGGRAAAEAADSTGKAKGARQGQQGYDPPCQPAGEPAGSQHPPEHCQLPDLQPSFGPRPALAYGLRVSFSASPARTAHAGAPAATDPSNAITGLLIHCCADGLAMGAAFLSGNARLTVIIAAAMVLHKVSGFILRA